MAKKSKNQRRAQKKKRSARKAKARSKRNAKKKAERKQREAEKEAAAKKQKGAADEKPKKASLSGKGDKHDSGKRPKDDPNEVARVKKAQVRELCERIGAVAGEAAGGAKAVAKASAKKSLAELLWEDAQDELKAAKDKGSYAQFKPLVLVADTSIKKVLEGLGYKKDGLSASFDFKKASLKTMLEGFLSFAEGISKKPKIRDRAVEGLREYVNERLQPGEKAVPKKRDQPEYAKKDKLSRAQRKREQDRTNKNAAHGAWEDRWSSRLDIFFSMFHLLVVFWPYITFDKKTVSEDWEKPFDKLWADRLKPAADAVVTLTVAVAKLACDKEGASFLKKLAADVRSEDPDLDKLEDELEETRTRRVLLTKKEKEERKKVLDDRREAQKKAKEDRKAEKKKSDAQLGGSRLKDMLEAFVGLLDAAMKLVGAYRKVWPADLSGDWDASVWAAGHETWLMTLARKGGSGDETQDYEGTISCRGYPYVRNNPSKGLDKGRPPIKEEKAKVKVHYVQQEDGGGTAQITWTPAGLSKDQRKVPCKADATFAGKKPSTDEAKVVSTGELVIQKSKLCNAPGAANRHPVQLTRPTQITDYLGLASAVVDLLGAVFKSYKAVLSRNEKRKLELKLNQLVEKLLAPITSRIPKWLVFGVSGGDLKLGFDASRGGLTFYWKLQRIFDHFFDDKKIGEAGHRSPYAPYKGEGSISFKKLEVKLGVEDWIDPTNDKKAGKSGMEDQLDKLAGFEWKEDIDKYVASKGVKYDLLPPAFDAGDLAKSKTPGVLFPLVLYVGEVAKPDFLQEDKKKGKKAAAGNKPAAEAEDDDVDKWQIYAKLTLSTIIRADLLAQAFPQLRACLFAWEMGYAAGTALRHVLLQWGPYKRAEERAQARIADFLYETGFVQSWCAVHDQIMSLRRMHFISSFEAFIACSKVQLYTWREEIGETGYPEGYFSGQYDSLQGVLERRRKIMRAYKEILASPKGQNKDKKALILKDRAHDPCFVDSEVEIDVCLYLSGDTSRSRSDLEKSIDAAVKAGELLPPRGEVLKLYLRAQDADSVEEAIRETARTVSRYNQNQPDQTSIKGRKTPVRDLKKYDATQWEQILRHEAGFRTFVKCLTFPHPDKVAKNRFLVLKDRRGAYHWQVQLKEPYGKAKVVFWEEDSGPDDRIVVRKGRRSQKDGVSGNIRRHILTGSFKKLRKALKDEAEGWDWHKTKGYADVYVQILDKNNLELFDSSDQKEVVKLTVDHLGNVTNASPVG